MSDYTILRGTDAPDYRGDAPGEFRGYGRPLGAEQVAFNLVVIPPHAANAPPGSDDSFGHHHETQEEIYFVVSGQVKLKLGDEIETLGPRDAIRIAPHVVRAVRNDGEEDAVMILCSIAVENIREEAVIHDGFWAREI